MVPARDGAASAPPASGSARRRPTRPSGSWSSSSPPTRPGRCTSAAVATPPTATALVRLLEAVGHEVEREFYVNDAGGQIERFAASIAARMRGEEPPEDGYDGEYVVDLGERIAAEGIDPGDLEAIGRRGVELMLENVRGTLDRFGVRFDNWFSERDLYSRGEVDAALGAARAARATPTAAKTRSGCARRPSATTRTGC